MSKHWWTEIFKKIYKIDINKKHGDSTDSYVKKKR